MEPLSLFLTFYIVTGLYLVANLMFRAINTEAGVDLVSALLGTIIHTAFWPVTLFFMARDVIDD